MEKPASTRWPIDGIENDHRFLAPLEPVHGADLELTGGGTPEAGPNELPQPPGLESVRHDDRDVLDATHGCHAE